MHGAHYKPTIGGVLVPPGHQSAVLETAKTALSASGYGTPSYLQKQDDLYKSLLMSPQPRFRRKLLPGLTLLGAYDGINDPGEAHERVVQLLRKISNTWFIRAIIETRIRQVKRFCKRPRFRGDVGISIRMADPQARPSAGDEKRMQAILEWVLRSGDERDTYIDSSCGVYSADGFTEAPPLRQAVAMYMRDTLTLDMVCQWIEPTGDRRWPFRFITPVDAGLIRRTFPKLSKDAEIADLTANYTPYQPKMRPNLDHAEWVMVNPTNPRDIVAEYSRADMQVMIRNPRTDWWAQGYGYSEVESVVELVLGLMSAVQFNTSWFTENHVPPALLVGSGQFSQDWLNDFLSTIMSQVGGPGKWHKLPAIFGEAESKLQVIPLKEYDRQDMAWQNWINFLIAACCSVMQISPEEVNFGSFKQSSGGLGEKNDTMDRVVEAKDTGLRDLCYEFEAFINALVGRFFADGTGWGPYRLFIVGVDEEDEERELKLQEQRLNAGITSPNRILAERDEALFYDPQDPELWDKLKTQLRERAKELGHNLDEDPPKFDRMVSELYTEKGGKLRRWPDLPISPNASQARTMEIQGEQQAEAGPDGMGGPEEDEQPGAYSPLAFGGRFGQQQPNSGVQPQQGPNGRPQQPMQRGPVGLAKSVGAALGNAVAQTWATVTRKAADAWEVVIHRG